MAERTTVVRTSDDIINDAIETGDDNRVVNGVRTRVGQETYSSSPIARVTDADPHAADTTTDDEETTPEIEARKAEIEATRDHMSATIDAIKDKLSPAHMVEEAKEAVKEAVVGKAEDALSGVSSSVSGVVEAVKDKAGQAVDMAKDAYEAVAGKVSGVIHGGGGDDKYDTAVMPIASDAKIYTPRRYATAGNLGETIVETIKLNPLPAAIAGFGLGWLILSIQRQNSLTASTISPSTARDWADDAPRDRYDSAAYGTNYGNMLPGSYDTGNGIRDRVSDVAGTVSDRVSGVAGTVGDKVSGVASTVSDKANAAAQAVSSTASDLKDKAGDFASTAADRASVLRDRAGDTVHNLGVTTRQQAGAATDTVDTFIHENPLAAGAIALLIGVAVGMSLPSTQKEHEILGPQRDRLLDQATDAAQDYANKAQKVAEAALGQAKDNLAPALDQAKQQLGQTIDQAKQGLQDAVQHTKETAVSEAQNQGLTTPA